MRRTTEGILFLPLNNRSPFVISLSTLSTIQSFVQRKEEPTSKSEKKELVMALQGMSRRECEKHLIAIDPAAASPKERERVVSPTQTEIRFVADDALMEKLQKIRELDGHVTTEASFLELFHRLADITLKKLDPISSKNRICEKTPESVQRQENKPLPKDIQTSTPPAESNLRFIPAALKREVWRRDQSQCSFKSSDGKSCRSKFALEIDHKLPVALGGKSEFSNLQLLCREHNRHKAVIQRGNVVMKRYMR